ncbi:MAG: EAL domain-containing protein [Rhodospirillales bacterium]|nr:EAL domain-containing protein [Rhodospirillales bacterium]
MAETRVSAATSPNGAVSEESLLLAHLQRLEHAPAGCCAVLCHLSDLQAPYRKAHFVRIAARSFDTLTNHFDATLYVLANSDVALVCRNVRVEDIDTAIYKLRALFAEDPLAAGAGADGVDGFATWYDLSEWADLADLEEAIAGREAELRQNQEAAAAGGPPMVPLDAAGLVQLEKRLHVLRLTDVVRQQPAVDVRPGRGRSILFKEHYVAMAELRQRIAPDVDLFASPWLFHYMADILDRRMLAVIGRMNFATLKDAISLNLHVGSVTSPEFKVFDEQIGEHSGKVIVEIQMVDIVADMGAFIHTRQRLRERGYRLLIDGLFPMALQFFDPGLLEPDFIKINWSPDLGRDQRSRQRAELGDMIRYIGPDTFVLARAESEDAIRWGLNLGLHRFQGFFVDKLADAMASKGLM